jgi:hypothetical protein
MGAGGALEDSIDVADPRKSLVPVGSGAKYQKFYYLLEPGSQIWVVTRISGEFSLA